jgi:hypothetical protein
LREVTEGAARRELSRVARAGESLVRLLAFFFLTLCLALPALALSARAETLSDSDAGQIRGIIGQQLQAFQVDDGNRAFSFASPVLQEKFGDPGTFMEMVRGGYDPVYRPSEVEFRALVLQGHVPVQDVLFVDRNGKAWLAHYSMTRMDDGSWRISGVWLEELPDLST